MRDAPISGWCDPAFAPVREAFVDNFATRGEVGAGVSVVVDGRVVVDLGGGWADAARTRPWQPDTIVDFYSVGKALVGLLALCLVDAGRLDLYDALLNENDQDLYQWVTGQVAAPERFAELIADISQALQKQ